MAFVHLYLWTSKTSTWRAIPRWRSSAWELKHRIALKPYALLAGHTLCGRINNCTQKTNFHESVIWKTAKAFQVTQIIIIKRFIIETKILWKSWDKKLLDTSTTLGNKPTTFICNNWQNPDLFASWFNACVGRSFKGRPFFWKISTNYFQTYMFNLQNRLI